MPTTETLTVKADEVRKGDLLLLSGKQFTAESVDVKVKWVHLSGITSNGTARTHRAERDWTIAVQREVETIEERVEREARMRDERYTFVLEDLYGRATKAFARQHDVITEIADHESKGYRIDARDAENMMDAALHVDFWAHVLRNVGHTVELPWGDEVREVKSDIGLAFLIVRNMARNDLMENRYNGTSTSGFHNVVADLAREVVTKLATNRYGGGGMASVIEEHWDGYELDQYDSGALSSVW